VLSRIERVKETQAMRRRIREVVTLRRLATADTEAKQPVGKPAE
jgi:hypothetical protein